MRPSIHIMLCPLTCQQRDKCIKVAKQYLEDGASVVVGRWFGNKTYAHIKSADCLIDNTNRDREARAHWVKIAKEFKIPIRCVLFTASAKLCEHNDSVRAYSSVVSMSLALREMEID